MKTNEYIELPDLDKMEISNRAKKQALNLYDVIDVTVSKEIRDKLFDLVEKTVLHEVTKERFKILRQELYIKELENNIENLKRQIK